MLSQSDNSIQQGPIVRFRNGDFALLLDKFLYSPWYFAFLAFITLMANLFAMELPMYVICILLGVCISLFGRDYLPMMPMVICCYISPSAGNNPGRHEASIFFGASGLVLILMAAVFVVSLIFRLATDPVIGQKSFFTARRRLLPGILALGASYLLAGAGSGHYFDQGFGNLLFAFLQFIAVFLLYFLFTGAVRWDLAPKKYLAWTGLCIGFTLLGEIVGIYIFQNLIVDSQINRDLFYTGWGHYNNVGALLTVMLPFALQLACDSKRGWAYYLTAIVFLAGVVMTCSRASILFAVVIYVVSCFVMIFKSKRHRDGVIFNAITFGIILVMLVVFYKQLLHLFSSMFSNSVSISHRFQGYKAGIAQFLEHPVFGGTFYPLNMDLYSWSHVDAFTSFFPPRWHNTFIQIAASCGIVGLVSYTFHRIQTLCLLLRKPTLENVYIGLSVAALLLMSLLDCHFFNIGPTLFYSMALAFGEKHNDH